MASWNPDVKTLRRSWLVAPIGAAAAGLFVEESWRFQLLGLAATWLLATLIGPLVTWAAKDREIPSLSTTTGTVTPFAWDEGRRGPFVLGVAEATLFYASLAARAPEIAGAWLLFKTAAKWAAWQHIMQMPGKLDGVDEVEYMEYRHAFSSKVVTTFMLGTLMNLLVAGAGLVVAKAVLGAS